MNEKNNKGLFVVIVFLIILVIGLASYIIYREISLTNEKQNKIEEVDNNEDKEPIPKNEISDVSQFPQKSDDSVIYSGTLESLLLNPEVDLNDNFKNVKFKKDNIDYSVSCLSYNPSKEDPYTKCEQIEIKFESFSKEVYYNLDSLGCSDETYVLLTNNYLIEQRISGCGDGGSINVFDKKGNQVFHVESSVAHYFSDSYEEGVDTIIAVINNVLYYISYNEEDFSNSSSGNLYFNSLDLSNLKLNKIQTFNAYLAGLA